MATALVAAITPSLGAKAVSGERSYVFTTIDVPGASKTWAMDRNASGDIVGYYMGTQFHGFLLHAGTFTTLDYPGADVAWTQANTINAAGDIAGTYSLKSPAEAGNVHGFLLTKAGKWSTVDYPQGTHIMAGGPYGIAADGTIVGCFHDGTATAITAMHGYLSGPKGATGSDYPAAAPYSMHYGVTPDGKTIVGAYLEGTNTPDHWHGYFLKDGKVTPFDLPGKAGTQALGIGPTGNVVGVYRVLVDKTWNAHGYVAETGGSLNPADWSISLVDVPGATQTAVRGIDAAGNLVGYYFDASGVTHGFTASIAPPAAAPAAPPPAATAPAPLPPSTGTGLEPSRWAPGGGLLAAGTALVVLAFAGFVASRARQR